MNSDLKKPIEELSYKEVLLLQDEILLQHEIYLQGNIRFTEGRVAKYFITFISTGLVWLVLTILLKNHLKAFDGNPILLLAPVAIIFVGIVIADKVWIGIGFLGRLWSRRAIHYWPVTLYLLSLIVGTLVQLRN